MKRKKNGFGAYLQELRTAAGWTLRDLSKASGVSPTHLWSIEHGTSPKLESLAALSRVFKQPRTALYGRSGEHCWMSAKPVCSSPRKPITETATESGPASVVETTGSEEKMSEVVYLSKSHIERERGLLRIAHLPGEPHPVAYSVHGAIAEHYKVDRSKLTEPHASTIDYVISATAG